MTNSTFAFGFYVIVPGFNATRFLNDLARSLSSQTYQGPKTVIFVDDGSNDETLQLMETIEVGDFRKHVLSIEHGGLSAARNAALAWVKKNASDGYVLFLDADDMLENNALQVIADHVRDKQHDVLAFTARVFFENSKVEQSQQSYKTYYQRRGSYPEALSGQEYLSAVLSNGDFRPSVCLQAFSTSFLKESGLTFFPGIIHEDNLFSLMALLLARKVKYIDYELYSRRVREGSIMTASAEAKSLNGYFQCILEAIRFINRNKLDVLSVKDCSIIFNMWRNLAIDQLNKLDQTQITELIGDYPATDQILFNLLIQDCVKDRNQYELQAERMIAEAQIDIEKKVREQFENSASFRLGRAITCIPRKLLGR